MLKPQDCIILLKLLANPKDDWSQRELANRLGISLSEVNGGIKRLIESGLLRKDISKTKLIPILSASLEFIIHSIKYQFPAKLGEYTRGMPTAIGATIIQEKVISGSDPIPVWPDIQGEKKGVALLPIHPAIPKILYLHPDKNFYELLVLIDTIRMGKVRERTIAIQLLKEKLNDERNST